MQMVYTIELTIQNPSGLHARPAATVVKAASRCKGRVIIHKGDKQVNAKSIVSILTAGIHKGDTVVLEVETEDQAEFETLVRTITDLEG